jgi:hypothetical protein
MLYQGFAPFVVQRCSDGDRTKVVKAKTVTKKPTEKKQNRQLKGNNRSAHGVIYLLKRHVGRMSVYSNSHTRKTRCYNRSRVERI